MASPRAVPVMAVVAMLVSLLAPADRALGQGERYFREAREAYGRRDFDEAIRLYTRAIESSDIRRGLVYCRQRQFERAIGDFDAALRICPTCPAALAGRAAAGAGKDCR